MSIATTHVIKDNEEGQINGNLLMGEKQFHPPTDEKFKSKKKFMGFKVNFLKIFPGFAPLSLQQASVSSLLREPVWWV